MVLGFDDDTFRPHAPVIRAQVATMISRALGQPGEPRTTPSGIHQHLSKLLTGYQMIGTEGHVTPEGEPPFADAHEVPDWQRAMWLHCRGYRQGL